MRAEGVIGRNTHIHTSTYLPIHTHMYTCVYMTRGEPLTCVTRHRLSLGSRSRWRAAGRASTSVAGRMPARPPWTSSAGPQAGERVTFQQKQSGRRPAGPSGAGRGSDWCCQRCLIPCQPLKSQECCFPKATCS